MDKLRVDRCDYKIIEEKQFRLKINEVELRESSTGNTSGSEESSDYGEECYISVKGRV